MSETSELNDLIRQYYSALDDEGVEAIAPVQLAEIVFAVIDPESASPVLVKQAALLELRALARVVCRSRQVEEETKAESGNLFDFQLQPRYPVEREGEDYYVLRSRLSLAERRRNIDRLMKESESKRIHAQALEAETEDLIRKGMLKQEQSI